MSLFICALATALRIAWVLAVPSKPVGDFAMYVESAAHLATHGALDPYYVYMPGYVFLLAPVQWLGGGWLACKLVGAVLGGIGTGAVIGLGRAFAGGDRRAGWIAGGLYAIWPAGIAVASVTGTDMPAAVFVGLAAYLLVRDAGDRPLRAAILFGLLTGVGAYIRAIVVPLAALGILVFRARGHAWKKSAAYAAIAVAVAFATLAPWAIRNRLRYGETFFTDSHGGLTLLVGAFPNTDGCYSRSLNRMFEETTGYTLLAEPHRAADHASLAIAKDWIRFEPTFAFALLADKAERLLAHERALLYWPLFRKGVLREPHAAFFARHRAFIENLADGFWFVLAGLALAGAVFAVRARAYLALTLIPQAVALAALYIAIFAEPRYRLPITLLCFPLAAYAITTLARFATHRPRGFRTSLAMAGVAVAVLFIGAPAAVSAIRHLRDAHRFAATQCHVDGQARFCLWRQDVPRLDTDGRSVMRGVWDGVGISLRPPVGDGPALAELHLPGPTKATQVSLALDLAPDTAPAPTGTVTLLADGQPLGDPVPLADIAAAGTPVTLTRSLSAPPTRLSLAVAVDGLGAPIRLWATGLRLE